jgi:hypothetical protein
VTTWLGLIPFLVLAPTPSPSQALPCQPVSHGDALRVTTKTLVYVFPFCRDASMTREQFVEEMACEGRSHDLALQVRRLQPRFAKDGITLTHCPAGARVTIEGADGTLTSEPLVENREFFGTVLLAPKRRPARLLGHIPDEELLRLLKAYFQ